MKTQQRPSGCLSDFALDRVVAGELAGDDATPEHLRECDRCKAREKELRDERDAFDREPPFALRARSRRRSSTLVLAGTSAFAAAAALVLLLRSPVAGEVEGTRTKGTGERLSFFVKHGDAVRPAVPLETVEPGDALRFVYSAIEPRHLTVLGLDGARRASVYVSDGPSSVAIAAGTDVALSTSTVLDEVLGRETIYGVFCARSFEVEPLRRSLEETGDLRAPAGCRIETLSFTKEHGPR